jgi:hypothetical protein
MLRSANASISRAASAHIHTVVIRRASAESSPDRISKLFYIFGNVAISTSTESRLLASPVWQMHGTSARTAEAHLSFTRRFRW